MEKGKLLLQILRDEINPSFGCSGPIGVAIAACEAADAVKGSIKKIDALIDKDMCAKNSDVGIPPSGIKGIQLALAVGALFGEPGAGLQVLRRVTPEQVESALAFVASGAVVVTPDWETETIGVYADVHIVTDRGVGRAIVAKSHSNLVYKEGPNGVQFGSSFSREDVLDESHDAISDISIHEIVNFSKTVDFQSLLFLQEAIHLNTALCDYGLSQHSTSSGFGRSLYKREKNHPLKKAKAMACAAAEARMEGSPFAAMSCATSGNAGIAVTMPLVSLAEDYAIDKAQLLRALACGYLITIKCKNKIGRHSALCACSVGASLGVASGTVVLLGGTAQQTEMAIDNTVVNVFGVLCDGAREACALKLGSAAECGIEGAFLALDNVRVKQNEGVCGASADDSIAFMGMFARSGMKETDRNLCKFLYSKRF